MNDFKKYFIALLAVIAALAVGGYYYSTKSAYTEKQLTEMLMPENKSEQSLARREKAIKYIFSHPEKVHPFMYADVSAILLNQGNMGQAAFWYYIFQSRSRAWAAKDPDRSQSTALRASLAEVLGRPINVWIASDPNAFHNLALQAIAYEKTFPYYSGKIDTVPEAEWQQALKDGRQGYEAEFTAGFRDMLADGGNRFVEQRKVAGLYVGPWKGFGKPLEGIGKLTAPGAIAPETAAVEEATWEQKLLEDEKLTAAFERAREELLAEIREAKADTQSLDVRGVYWGKRFKLEGDHADRVNALGLKCPKTPAGDWDTVCMKRMEDIAAKANASTEDFDKRYKLLAQELGAK